MINQNEYLTKEKYDELEKELEYLKSTKRKEIAEALEFARSLGDLSENQEYQDARDNQAVLEDRIGRIEKMLKSASIVTSHSSDIVSVGSVVVVEKVGESTKKTFTIVGSEEADASTGKISVRSPFGTAIVGKGKNEMFSFETPSGRFDYKILEIK